MEPSDAGFPKPPASADYAVQALVYLVEKHGLESSVREILAAIEARKRDIETRKRERQKKARLALLEDLLDGRCTHHRKRAGRCL